MKRAVPTCRDTGSRRAKNITRQKSLIKMIYRVRIFDPRIPNSQMWVVAPPSTFGKSDCSISDNHKNRTLFLVFWMNFPRKGQPKTDVCEII